MTRIEFQRVMKSLVNYRRAETKKAEALFKKELYEASMVALERGRFPEIYLKARFKEIFEKYKNNIDDKILELEKRAVEKALEIAGVKLETLTEYKVFKKRWFFEDLEAEKITIAPENLISESARPYDLSPDVWGEMQEKVFAVIEEGRRLGRDVKTIGKDLEILVKYPDGGKRVKGRWLYMKPKEKKDDEDGIYETRLGEAGLDYRVIRVLRTEGQREFNERLTAQAKGFAGTGKVKRILSPHRDAWKCFCLEAKDWINRGGGKEPEKIPHHFRAPLHPNCECYDEPVFLTEEELTQKTIERIRKGA